MDSLKAGLVVGCYAVHCRLLGIFWGQFSLSPKPTSWQPGSSHKD